MPNRQHTRINFDGSYPQAARLEHEADATGDHALADATNDTARYQHVLHVGGERLNNSLKIHKKH